LGCGHGKLYASIPSTDPTAPNSIIPIDPVKGSAGPPVAAGNNPDRLAISSDSAYLWVGLDGDNAVQRFLLPGLTKDISFTLPLDSFGETQRPVDLQAAPINPHTVALVSKNINLETGQGVYVYDDAVRRSSFVPNSSSPGGALIDWIQWAGNDSKIYGSQSITLDAGGVATLNVNSSGVSLASYNGGQIGPPRFIQYDKSNGRLYSYDFAFNPIDGSLIGQFPIALGERSCTADSSLSRYFCPFAIQENDVSLFELWVYDLDGYALIDRLYFGASAGTPLSTITGTPLRLVRWGNAGLGLITQTDT
jgi:DNA-binding beta-propeller fold protein YncE